jgi:hypothetical protein
MNATVKRGGQMPGKQQASLAASAAKDRDIDLSAA